MSAQEDFFTIDQLAARLGMIVVNCRTCSQRKMFYATELAYRGAGRRTLRSLTFHCGNCGKRTAKGSPYIPFRVHH